MNAKMKSKYIIFFVLVSMMIVFDVYGVSVIDSGTSFPANPAVGQEFFRTDNGQHNIFNGSQWVAQDLAVYNIKTFGAVGNATADDTNAIQAALNKVTWPGGTVFIPPGNYKVVRALSVPSNCTILGVGWQSIIMAPQNATNVAILVNSDPNSGNSNIRVANLHITGNRTYNTGGYGNYGIHFTRCLNVVIENVFINEIANNCGIAFRDCQWFVIRNCLLKEIYGTAIYFGVPLSGSTGVGSANGVITGNVIKSTTTQNGIFLAGGNHDIEIVDNRITEIGDCGIEVGGVPGDGRYNKYVTVKGNIIDNCADGILMRNTEYCNVIGNNCRSNVNNGIVVWPDAITAHQNVISGNICLLNNANGIKVANNARQTSITSNNCDDNAGSGILAEGDQQDLLINANTTSNNGAHGIAYSGNSGGGFSAENAVISNNSCRDNTNYGIVVANMTNSAIGGNNCYDSRAAGSKVQIYGILTTDNSNYIVINDNMLKGNRTAGLSTVGANNMISNNMQ